MNNKKTMTILEPESANRPRILYHTIYNKDGNPHTPIMLESCAREIREDYKANNKFRELYNTIKEVAPKYLDEVLDRCTVVAYLAYFTSAKDRWSLICKYLKYFNLQDEYDAALSHGVGLLNSMTLIPYTTTSDKIAVLKELLHIAPAIANDLQNESEVKHWIDTINSQTHVIKPTPIDIELIERVISDIQHEVSNYARSMNLPESIQKDLSEVIQSCDIDGCNSSILRFKTNKPLDKPE
jgi:hypothetical protein